MTWDALRYALSGVCAYRNLLTQSALEQTAALLEALGRRDGPAALSAYGALFYALGQEGYAGLADWLWDKLRYEEGPYPLLIESGGEDAALAQAARRDVATFSLLAGTLDGAALLKEIGTLLRRSLRPCWASIPAWLRGWPSTSRR